MTDKDTLWLTVEEPTEDELRAIQDTLEDTSLSDKYDLLITSDGIDTFTKDELQQFIDDLQATVEE